MGMKYEGNGVRQQIIIMMEVNKGKSPQEAKQSKLDDGGIGSETDRNWSLYW